MFRALVCPSNQLMRIYSSSCGSGSTFLPSFKQLSSAASDKQILQIGDSASVSKTMSREDVNRFAELTLDTNPLHIDEEYAATTMFRKPIVHGMFCVSLYTSILGTKLPGVGSVFLDISNIKFPAPVYIGETVTTIATVEHIDRRAVTLNMEGVVQDAGKIVMTGTCKVLAPKDRVPPY